MTHLKIYMKTGKLLPVRKLSGYYYENINFNGKNVLLHGGDDINIPDPDHVIIDANYQGTGVKFVWFLILAIL